MSSHSDEGQPLTLSKHPTYSQYEDCLSETPLNLSIPPPSSCVTQINPILPTSPHVMSPFTQQQSLQETNLATLNTMLTTPPCGKQYTVDELPPYSLILSQNYVEMMDIDKFRSFFATSTNSFKDLPDSTLSAHTQFKEFIKFYEELKNGDYSSKSSNNPTTQTILLKYMQKAIQKTQKWSHTTYNPHFTDIIANTKSGDKYITKITHKPIKDAIYSNIPLLLSETEQLYTTIHSSDNNNPDSTSILGYELNPDDIVLRCTTTAHAIVFDIINIAKDPFFYYHTISSHQSMNNLTSTDVYNLNNCPITFPQRDISVLPYITNFNTQQQLSNTTSTSLYGSPLSLQRIPAITNQQVHPTAFDYYNLQPPLHSLKSFPNTPLYGSFSFKFIIPLGNILAVPQYTSVSTLLQQYYLKFTNVQNIANNPYLAQTVSTLQSQYQQQIKALDSQNSQHNGEKIKLNVNNVLSLKKDFHNTIENRVAILNSNIARILGDKNQNNTSPIQTPYITPLHTSLTTLIVSTPDNYNFISKKQAAALQLQRQQELENTRRNALTSSTAAMSMDMNETPTVQTQKMRDNQYNQHMPVPLDELTTYSRSFIGIVSLCCLYNNPITFLWQQQFDLLLSLCAKQYHRGITSTNNDENNDSLLLFTTPQLSTNQPQQVPVNTRYNSSLVSIYDIVRELDYSQITDHMKNNNQTFFVNTYPHYSRHHLQYCFNYIRQRGVLFSMNSPSFTFPDQTIEKNQENNTQRYAKIVNSTRLFQLPNILHILQLFAQSVYLAQHQTLLWDHNNLILPQSTTSQNSPSSILPHPGIPPTTSLWSIVSLPQPRSMLIACNPKGGAGHAVSNVNKITPLLNATGHQIHIYVTQCAGDVIAQARQSSLAFGWGTDPHKKLYQKRLWLLSSQQHENDPPATPFLPYDVQHFYDCLALMSGDGLVNEAVNGIFKSSHWGYTINNMSIAHLPSGSGNGMSASINSISHTGGGIDDAFYLCLHGNTRKLDMFTVTQDPLRPCGNNDDHNNNRNEVKNQQKMQHFTFFKEFNEKEQEFAQNPPYTVEKINELSTQHVIPTNIPMSTPLPPGVQCGVLSLSWALISDLDFESEKWRCMGGARFEFTALLRICCLRQYKARVEVLLDESSMNDLENDGMGNAMLVGNEAKRVPILKSKDFHHIDDDSCNHQRDLITNQNQHTSCGMKCRVCLEMLLKTYERTLSQKYQENGVDLDNNIENALDIEKLDKWAHGDYVFKSIAPTPLEGVLGTIHGSVNAMDHSDISTKKTIVHPEKWLPLYSSSAKPGSITSTSSTYNLNSNDNIHTGADDYTVIWGFNVSHGAKDAIGSPFSHLNDGLFDLYYINQCGRLQLLDLLTGIEKGQHINQENIQHLKVKGFRLDPCVDCDEYGHNDTGKSNSCLMSLDGERMLLKPVELRMWSGLLNLICKQ